MKTGKCACKGDFLDRFIQPEILMLLCGQPMHGFSILKEYNRRTGVAGAIDPTGLYRTLKKMEENGLLASDLDTMSTSKPRRIYSVTSEGLSLSLIHIFRNLRVCFLNILKIKHVFLLVNEFAFVNIPFLYLLIFSFSSFFSSVLSPVPVLLFPQPPVFSIERK